MNKKILAHHRLDTAIFIVAAVPIAAAFYLVDDALQRSLNLGFNPQVLHSLDMGAKNLKTLKRIDPANEPEYRAEFDEIQDLTRIYAQPQLVKGSIRGSLKIYFGLGLLAAALAAVGVATLLGRRIGHSYEVAIRELLAHRERVRYLEQMSSWQEMAKALAHEIKNPLTPIELLVTLLTKSHASKAPEEFARQLEQTRAMIEEEIRQLKRTVSRYSDFAKLPPAELVEADPVQVIKQHLSAVEARFINARIVVNGDDTADDLRARMDPSLFRPVLMNIIGNGVEANPGREVIFTIEVSATQSSIHVNILNDGVAVPAQIAPRIFDPYVSGGGGRDNMGLGLAIVKKIIMEHEGEVAYGEIDGIELFKIVQTAGFEVPTLFISGNATLTQAAEAVRIGAFDFLEKPFSAERIVVAVKHCLEFSPLKERLRLSEARRGPDPLIGDSPAIKKVMAAALKVARTGANVLISGESGTGKELVANAIHAHSDRREMPFVKVNCSAIPENLIESELFGYIKGAFTGAVANKRGLFEVAHRGTIFLDEVADLSLSAQAKILRVVQSGEMQKVGSEEAITVDVRVLSGSHKDLKTQVAAGLFREDLYYRLNVVPIRVPSLKERPDDIPLLARFFARRVCEKNNVKEKAIEDDVLSELKGYPWPGNVRELQNVIERMVTMSGERISPLDIPEEIAAVEDYAGSRHAGSALREFRDQAERDFILATLKRNLGNISQSAIELGVGRSYLHRRLAVLGIAKKDWFS